MIEKLKGIVVGVYKITSPSGRVYIGQSWHIKSRWRLHLYENNSRVGNSVLVQSFKKYGAENHTFQVVHVLPFDTEQVILDNYEKLYIEQYRYCGFKMANLREGGKNARHTDETLAKMSEKMKGNTWGFKKGRKSWNDGTVGVCVAWNKGKTGIIFHSDETKRKLSEFHKGNKYSVGRKMTSKTREAIAKANIGRKMPDNVSIILSKYRTPENAKRMGYMNRGKVRTDENKKKISDTLKNRIDNKGELSSNVKVTTNDVLEIRNKYKPRIYTSRRLAKEYNLSKTNILDIIHRRIWQHV